MNFLILFLFTVFASKPQLGISPTDISHFDINYNTAISVEIIQKSGKLVVRKVKYEDGSVYAFKSVPSLEGPLSCLSVPLEKRIEMQHTSYEYLKRELSNFEIIECVGSHPYLVRLIHQIPLYCIYAVPFFPQGPASIWPKMSSSSLKQLASEMIQAVQFLHQNSFVHLDIKPSNIFHAVSGNYVLGGFGKAFCWYEDGKLPNISSRFSNPQVMNIKRNVKKDLHLQYIRPKFSAFCAIADYFSLGLTLAALKVGYQSVKDSWDLFRFEILSGNYPTDFEDDFRDLLDFLLKHEPLSVHKDAFMYSQQLKRLKYFGGAVEEEETNIFSSASESLLSASSGLQTAGSSQILFSMKKEKRRRKSGKTHKSSAEVSKVKSNQKKRSSE